MDDLFEFKRHEQSGRIPNAALDAVEAVNHYADCALLVQPDLNFFDLFNLELFNVFNQQEQQSVIVDVVDD